MSSHTSSGHYLGSSAEFVGIAAPQQQFSLSGLTESSLSSSQPVICIATLLIVRKVRRLSSVLTPSVNVYCWETTLSSHLAELRADTRGE